ncbi:MAG: hypothetical protein Q9217_001352 [Psora testacea]
MTTSTDTRRDPNTLSNYHQFTTIHTQVNLDIDFNKRILAGNIVLNLKPTSTCKASSPEIVLDTSYLDIQDVEVNLQSCEWVLQPRTDPFGSALRIKLDKAVEDGHSVEVNRTLTEISDIQMAPIGPRSQVATSPEALQAAKWEFQETTERYIETLENIVYPYQWTEYNLLVLPPSFPYGGMENIPWVFVTPTTVSGDRENVDVVAHELSHSYAGNLVTAATWMDFWLNEGWTTYLERRLQAALFGEAHRDLSAIIGWKALNDSVNHFGKEHEFTKMIPDLNGRDPDDAFSRVPYEKGYTFLSYLEAQVGKDKWSKYIPHYFTTFARLSITSNDFKDNLFSFFAPDSAATAVLKTVDWDEWFHAPGLPPEPDFDTLLVDVCYALASKWENVNAQGFKPAASDIEGWRANQIVVFLNSVQAFLHPLTKEQAKLMGETYGFFKSKNFEVTARYFGVGLRSRDEGVYQPTGDLLSQVGRMKFVRPLYKQLNEADRKLALDTFERNKDFYHPICRGLVEKDLMVAK